MHVLLRWIVTSYEAVYKTPLFFSYGSDNPTRRSVD